MIEMFFQMAICVFGNIYDSIENWLCFVIFSVISNMLSYDQQIIALFIVFG